MQTIKFNHIYAKLHGAEFATLLRVDIVDIDSISSAGLLYDTTYFDHGEKKYFRLDSGIYFRLIFIGDDDIPFTTYRKFNISNSLNYLNSIGQLFKVVIEN